MPRALPLHTHESPHRADDADVTMRCLGQGRPPPQVNQRPRPALGSGRAGARLDLWLAGAGPAIGGAPWEGSPGRGAQDCAASPQGWRRRGQGRNLPQPGRNRAGAAGGRNWHRFPIGLPVKISSWCRPRASLIPTTGKVCSLLPIPSWREHQASWYLLGTCAARPSSPSCEEGRQETGRQGLGCPNNAALARAFNWRRARTGASDFLASRQCTTASRSTRSRFGAFAGEAECPIDPDDDDNAAREVTAARLRELGCSVPGAGSGGAALELLEEAPSIGKPRVVAQLHEKDGARLWRGGRRQGRAPRPSRSVL
jgi:hypothetical protein